MNGVTQSTDVCSRSAGTPQQLRGAQRRPLRPVVWSDPIPSMLLPDLLAQQLPVRCLIDLGFFPRRGEDHGPRLWWLIAVQLVDETPHALIAAGKATIGNQVLPDRHGIATPAESQLDGLPVRLAGAGSGTAAGNRRQLHLKLRILTSGSGRQSPPSPGLLSIRNCCCGTNIWLRRTVS